MCPRQDSNLRPCLRRALDPALAGVGERGPPGFAGLYRFAVLARDGCLRTSCCPGVARARSNEAAPAGVGAPNRGL